MGDYNRESRAYIMTGFCGIYCGECECHKAKDDLKLMEYMKSKGIPNLPCPGCREVEGRCHQSSNWGLLAKEPSPEGG